MKKIHRYILAAIAVVCTTARSGFAAESTGNQQSLNIIEPFGEPILFPDSGSWGVCCHTPNRTESLKPLGTRWVRLGEYWTSVEVGKRGNYNWAGPDRVVNHSLENGFKILYCFAPERFNKLYEADRTNKDVVIEGVANWMAATAAHFKGKGLVYELGNEPEVFPMDGYWNNPITYTKMARLAASRMKATDPDCKIAAIACGWVDEPFISACLNAGLLDDSTIDIVSFHGYHPKSIRPEDGRAEQIAWMRKQIHQHTPVGKKVILVDSERGYAILPAGTPKAWENWRWQVYTESEQACYLARHYLEEIYNGLEMSIWYKDQRGEEAMSLYYGAENDPRGLRPMGHAYRNLAMLLPDNPKRMYNGQYKVTTVVQGKQPPQEVWVRSYLRHFKDGTQERKQLILSAWYTVEAFDGKILQWRKQNGPGGKYIEQWRPIEPTDIVEVPVKIKINGLNMGQVRGMTQYDLLAKKTGEGAVKLKPEAEPGAVLTPILTLRPMPVMVVVDLAP